MECRAATTFDWEWRPSTLQCLGKAQALRIYFYIYMYNTFGTLVQLNVIIIAHTYTIIQMK